MRRLLVFSLLALAACSSNPSTSAPMAQPQASAGQATAQVSLLIPRAASSLGRDVRTISPATQSVAIAVNGGLAQVFNATPSSNGCSPTMSGTTCTFTVGATLGSNTFLVSTYSGMNASGAILNQGSMVQTVTASGPNTFALALGIVVSTTNDSGAGSLRQAVIDANAGDAIAFVLPSNSTITLTGGAIALNKNVSIVGPGAASLTISGNGTSGIFVVNSGVTVNLWGVKLTQGYALNGGAILNQGTLTVSNATFSANTATTLYGGAIYSPAGSSLTVSNSTFTGNSAASACCGGAIYSKTALNVSNSTFSGNSALYGGAIDAEGGGTFTNDVFTGNTTSNGSYGYGGALYAATTGTVTISGGTFGNNGAGPVAPSTYGYGGAIYSTLPLLIGGATFSGNRAGGGGPAAYGYAGAIYVTAAATLTNCTLTNNTAGGGGYGYAGAIYATSNLTISGGSLAYNQAAGSPGGYAYGGAIYVTGSLSTSGVLFDHNSAVGGGVNYAYGGAVYGAGMTDTGSSFTNNSVTGSATGYSYGGAIYAPSASSFTGTLFSGNTANAYGGALYVASSTNLLNVTFTNNSVSSGSNPGQGGAVFSSGSLTMTGGSVTGNTAQTRGGGLWLNGGTIANVTISGNTVAAPAGNADGGGGIFSSAALTLTGSTLSGNTVVASAFSSGGGGILFGAAATLKNDTIAGNSSGNDGGGIYNNSLATVALINVTVFGNSATGSGGSIYTALSTAMVVQNTIIAGGSAATGNEISNGGSITSNDYNLIQGSISGSGLGGVTAHNITGSSPNLLALGNNGGPTKTLADQASSPGKDYIPLAICTGAGITTDQRGNARGDASDGVCDIGAYEFP